MKKLVKACLVLVSLVLFGLPDVAYACEKCFGASGDEATIQAVVMSMASLLAIVGFVGGGIGMFFIHMNRRAKMFEPGDLMVNEYGDLRPSSPPHESER